MQTIHLEQIKQSINLIEVIKSQEYGFMMYSNNQVIHPPVGYLEQYNPKGSYHIKYGMIEGDNIWVIKIAGGPYALPINGMSIVLSTLTGQPKFCLLDNGYLTNLRTAIAGLVAAKYLAPKKINAIGVLGTGLQARMQISMLKHFTDCRKLYVWGRSDNKVLQYKKYMLVEGFSVEALDIESLAKKSNLIVTTTTSEKPLLLSKYIQPGTHITALGADEPKKIELEPNIFLKSDIICVDSRAQCIEHGEIQQAVAEKIINTNALTELGEIIKAPNLGRNDDKQITIADLTGLAIQDIQIAKSVISKAHDPK